MRLALNCYVQQALRDGIFEPRMTELDAIYGNLRTLFTDKSSQPDPVAHQWKSWSGSMANPCACTVCGKRVVKGMKCTVCRYHVHKECEPKV